MHERYFDNAATTPVDPRVVEAMLPWFTEFPGNAHSLHHYGGKAMDAVEKARAQVAQLIGAEDPSQITFTSGATEANNWVLNALADQFEVSIVEHSSIRDTAEKLGIPFFYPPAEVPHLVSSIDAPPRQPLLRAQMLVNNETGTIFDERTRVPGAYLVDATQALGKIDFHVGDLEYVTGSAHKFFGPKGIGFLYQRFPGSIPPFITGGGQERGERSGTLNVPAIVGMGKAAEIAIHETHQRHDHVERLNEIFCCSFEGDFSYPKEPPLGEYRINGGDRRSSYIISLSFAGIEGETLLIELDQAGFCCSAGAACSSKNTEPSPVLKAFGVPDEYIRGTIRVSFSHYNTEESTYQLATEIRRIVTKLRELR
ncbi:MAG: IscS subfamily cysteine desulfurase [Armatimonadetes bacterium Cent15-Ar3]|nr:MAG: IscS subfamily cysteine desulfurase [Armatimonadetes bacterium Cent15-Ar3]